MTQNKARRTNKIDFLELPWAQEVPGSNPGAPTTYTFFMCPQLDPTFPEPITNQSTSRISGFLSDNVNIDRRRFAEEAVHC
jgi:hypothetical protein